MILVVAELDEDDVISVLIEFAVVIAVDVEAVEGSRMAMFKHKSSILPLLIYVALDGKLSHSKCSGHCQPLSRRKCSHLDLTCVHTSRHGLRVMNVPSEI